MPIFSSRQKRQNSGSSAELSTSSLPTWYGKRKRTSPSPSPPLRQASLASDGTSTDSSGVSIKSRNKIINGSWLYRRSQHATTPAKESDVVKQLQSTQQGNTKLATDQNEKLGQAEQDSGLLSNRKPVCFSRRRSSSRLLEIPPPRDFTAEELEKPVVLSRPSCPIRIGRVFQPQPEPGWRVATKPRSPQSCFTATHPGYSARRHSPDVTGRSFTIYFEGESTPGNSEDGVCVAIGFVAGNDRTSLMPGFERGSIGIHCRDGGLYVNNHLVKNVTKAIFAPGQRVGIGMTFSKGDRNAQKVDDAQSLTACSSSIVVEVFLSREGKKADSWNLSELKQSAGLAFEGLEGSHDLYAAVGTLREVNFHILFERSEWRYKPPAV